MKTQTEVKRILDYGYYCDLVELDNGDLRIDVNKEQLERMEETFNERIEDYFKNENVSSEAEGLDTILEGFDYLEFIPDLAYDERFGALTNSCALYHEESKRLWWYPNYQIHNIFERLIEDKQVIFSLAQ